MSAGTSGVGADERDGRADGDLTPDQLQLAFHEVECLTYDERFGIAYDDRGAREAAREVDRLLGPRRLGRVLDVGCGTGYLGLGLAASDRVERLHASDLSPGMLRRTRENAHGLGLDVQLVQATATALPYRDGAFDAVVTRGVLHHLHDPVAALREWRRVTGGGPVVVLSEPSPTADTVGGAAARAVLRALDVARGVAAAAGRPLSTHDPEARAHHEFWDLVAMAANLHTFTAAELRELGERSGFRDVRVDGSGLASIVWAASYYCLVGELPGLATSARARRFAARAYAALRRLDAAVTDRLLPDRALLTVQGVFSG